MHKYAVNLSRRGSVKTAGVSVLLAVALVTAGCGSKDDKAKPTPATSATPSATQTTVAPTTAPTAPPTNASDGGIPTCKTGQLAVAVKDDQGGGAAGSFYSGIAFTNKSSTTCAIYGWPGVSYVGNGNGTQIGAPADRTGSPKIVNLKPGKTGEAQFKEVNAGNFDETCSIHQVDGLRIYPPNNKSSVFVAHETQGCSSTVVHTLTIGPVEVK